jgi:hypothetical protein
MFDITSNFRYGVLVLMHLLTFWTLSIATFNLIQLNFILFYFKNGTIDNVQKVNDCNNVACITHLLNACCTSANLIRLPSIILSILGVG